MTKFKKYDKIRLVYHINSAALSHAHLQLKLEGAIMYLFISAIIIGVLGLIPLAIFRKFKLMPYFFFLGGGISHFMLYVTTPSTVHPVFGIPGFMGALIVTISAAVMAVSDSNDRAPSKLKAFAFIPTVLYVALFLLTIFCGADWFHASSLQSMIGQMDSRVWSQDIQPKDPKHIRLGTNENAVFMAKKALGSLGAVGSQFSISEPHMTQQMVKGQMWFVAPLDFEGFSSWQSTDGVPGYAMVNGENPKDQPRIVNLPEGKKMKFTPGAFFGDELERHLRNSGFLDVGLTDYTFEIDDNEKPWWVVSVYKYIDWYAATKVVGIVLVDPVDGACQYFELGKVPHWIDRAVPASYAKNYLKKWGEYVHGWFNSFWAKKDMVKPENPVLIYGTGDEPEWVVGITSKSEKDDSLVGIVYINARTGQAVHYKVNGGATDNAVLEAVNKNQDVQYRHLHGTSPQLYNIFGRMASIVPLLNDVHAFSGVAIVDITNLQCIAVGDDQFAAMRLFESKLTESGKEITFNSTRNLQVVVGIVDRCGFEIAEKNVIWYLHLTGIPHLFSATTSRTTAQLALTHPGDEVEIRYYAAEDSILPMHDFMNRMMPLAVSDDGKAVSARVTGDRDRGEAQQEGQEALEALKKLPPDELARILKKARNQ